MRSFQFPHQRILFVDDESSVRVSIKMLLTHDGHNVVTAEGGLQGLELFDPENFDMVITDNYMAGMTGVEFAIAIKKIAPHTPVIMMTAFPPQVIPEAVDLVLTKPFMLSHLRDGMQQLTTSRAIADSSS